MKDLSQTAKTLRLIAVMAVAGLASLQLMAQDLPAQAAPASPAASAATVAGPAAVRKPQLMVLGVYHFANPGLDAVRQATDDILSPVRQVELAQVVDHLSRWQPTRIAVEAEPANDPDLTKAFQAWRQQGRPLKRTEIEQLGFRLAGRLGLPGVQGVDWMGMPPGELNQYDYEAWSEARGEAAQAELRQIRADSQARSDAQFQLLGRQGLPAMLRALNDPAAQAADHQTYFRLARLGDEGWTAGANWVGTWMTRNLKMWQNLDRMAQPGDRVLLIVGAGHATLLKQFAAASGRFEVVDVLPHLPR